MGIGSGGLLIRPMHQHDLDTVIRLEQECFPHPWTRGMLEVELRRDNGEFLVALDGQRLTGYTGAIFILEEGHLTNLAVREARRRRGIASLLLLRLIELSEARGIRFLTLEVRRSNLAAIRLYEKFGFTAIGERKRYYLDDDEDAVIMWTEDITGHPYRDLLARLAAALRSPGEGGA